MAQEETRLNIKSSRMVPKPSVKVIDVIVELLNKDRVDEAVDLQLEAITITLDWDMDVTDVLELSVDDFVKLYKPPPRFTYPTVRGQWDNVIYGEAAFR